MLNKIRDALKSAYSPSKRTVEIKALLQMHNGGLMAELDSEEMVQGLKDNTIRKRFLQALNFTVTFKDRTFALVVQYVPVNLLIERPGLLRLIEGKNRLDNNSLISMRWIKPPHKRPPRQLMAFALLQVNDTDIANNLI
ncbi:hypothetical protein DFH29DRAFT_818025, partial [Suillus ampliporus]